MPVLRGRRVAALVIVLAALSGCAATREQGERLLGAPAEGGLVIIDCTLNPTYDYQNTEADFAKILQTGSFRLPGKDALDEVAIERTDAPGRYHYGTRFAGVLVFPRLEPGPYMLRSVGHGRRLIDHIMSVNYYLAKRAFPFGGATGNRITFTVVPGGLSYVGGIDVSARYEIRTGETPGSTDFVEANQDWQAVVNYSPVRERDAWAKLLRMSEGTHWTDLILGRIEALNSGVRFGPPD